MDFIRIEINRVLRAALLLLLTATENLLSKMSNYRPDNIFFAVSSRAPYAPVFPANPQSQYSLNCSLQT